MKLIGKLLGGIVNKLRNLKLSALVVGLLLILFTEVVYHISEAWYGHLGAALGEALVIAGLLGYLVDTSLKRGLVTEVADLVVKHLWGTNAPQDYVEAVRNSLGEIDRIGLSATIDANLSWATEKKVLKLILETETYKQNISSKEWAPDAPWMGPAGEGLPASEINEFQLIVRTPAMGARAPSVRRKRWAGDELEPFKERKPDGSVGLKGEIIQQSNLPKVLMGAACEARCTGTYYQRANDGRLIMQSSPTIATVVNVSGSAVSDLDVVIRVGGAEKALKSVDGKLSADLGFMYAGVAVSLEWSMKAPEQLALPRGGEGEIDRPQAVGGDEIDRPQAA